MSKISNAWLMEASGGFKFAVAEYEMIEYVIAPELISIPLTPGYCSSIMLWHDRMVPTINFGLMMGNRDAVTHNVSILAYQEMAGEELKYLGVCLQQAPAKIIVRDDQACDLSEHNWDIWHTVSASCFRHQEEAIPILDLAKLGSTEFGRKANDFTAEHEPPAMQIG